MVVKPEGSDKAREALKGNGSAETPPTYIPAPAISLPLSRASSTGSGQASGANSRANSPFPSSNNSSASVNLLDILSPGNTSTLPSFRKKTSHGVKNTVIEATAGLPQSGKDSSINKDTGMTKGSSSKTGRKSVGTSASASKKTPSVRGAAKQNATSTKNNQSTRTNKTGKQKGQDIIEWTSSEESDGAKDGTTKEEAAPGKGAESQTVQANLDAGGKDTPSLPNTASSGPRVPDRLMAKEATHNDNRHDSPVAPPWKSNSQPSSSEDSDDDDEPMAFDLDAQLQQALAASVPPVEFDGSISSETAREAQPPAQSLGQQQHPATKAVDSNAALFDAAGDGSDSDSDMEAPFDFNAHIAAAMAPLSEAIPEAHEATALAHSNGPERPAAPTADVHMEEEDSDDEGENDNQAFDLNAMLSAAMEQAVTEVADDPTSETPAVLAPASAQNQANNTANDNVDSDSDDDDDQPFDFDAQIQAAMSAVDDNAPAESTVPSKKRALDDGSDSDVDDDDDEAAFDLDAQIGAAMGGIGASLDDIIDDMDQAEAAFVNTDFTMPSLVEGVTSDDLQAMLRNAMQQAAMEVELEQGHFQPSTSNLTIEEMIAEQSKQNQASVVFDPNDDFDYDEDENNYFQDESYLGAGQKFVMADKPRIRRTFDDDGDPNNVFNRIRNWHGHALPNFYACDFKGCDRVFAKPDNQIAHRKSHIGPKPFKCPKCWLSFQENREFAYHYRTHDPTRRWRYRCKGCHNLFSERSMWERHLQEEQAADSDSKCAKSLDCELEMRRKEVVRLAPRVRVMDLRKSPNMNITKPPENRPAPPPQPKPQAVPQPVAKPPPKRDADALPEPMMFPLFFTSVASMPMTDLTPAKAPTSVPAAAATPTADKQPAAAKDPSVPENASSASATGNEATINSSQTFQDKSTHPNIPPSPGKNQVSVPTITNSASETQTSTPSTQPLAATTSIELKDNATPRQATQVPPSQAVHPQQPPLVPMAARPSPPPKTKAKAPAAPSAMPPNVLPDNKQHFFRRTPFSATPLLASVLVNQLSSVLAQQYDRENSLLMLEEGMNGQASGASSNKIDVHNSLMKTVQKAGLTPREIAALATTLATVASARNTNLVESLEKGKRIKIETVKKQNQLILRQQQQAHADMIKLQQEALRKQREEEVRRKKAEAAAANAAANASGGNTPVPASPAATHLQNGQMPAHPVNAAAAALARSQPPSRHSTPSIEVDPRLLSADATAAKAAEAAVAEMERQRRAVEEQQRKERAKKTFGGSGSTAVKSTDIPVPRSPTSPINMASLLKSPTRPDASLP